MFSLHPITLTLIKSSTFF